MAEDIKPEKKVIPAVDLPENKKEKARRAKKK